MSKKSNILTAIIFIVGTSLAGFLASMLSGNIKEIYAGLIKPPLSPPGWLFGVAWGILYFCMGLAAYLIYRHKTEASTQALFWYYVQLVLNLLWPVVFFRLGLYWAAAVVIVALDVIVAYLLALTKKIDKTAFWLLVPYFLWILFATYLNLGFAVLN